MGLLTDVVITDSCNATEVCEKSNSEEFIWKETPGLSVEMLVALLAVLSNKRISKALHKEFPLLHGSEQGMGPWAWQISDDLVKLLSRVKNSEIPDLASRWLNKDDEVRLLGLPLRGCLSNVKEETRDLASLMYRCSRDEKGRLLDIKEQKQRYRAALQVQGLEDVVLVLRDLCKKAVRRKTSLLLRVSL